MGCCWTEHGSAAQRSSAQHSTARHSPSLLAWRGGAGPRGIQMGFVLKLIATGLRQEAGGRRQATARRTGHQPLQPLPSGE